MYTTITERTREIGILKSLGASKGYIIGVIEKEALTISIIGVAAGLVVAFAAGWVSYQHGMKAQEMPAADTCGSATPSGTRTSETCMCGGSANHRCCRR